MALNEYEVEINGHKTTVQLSDADAKAQGLLKEPAKAPAKAPVKKAAAKPANKARGAAANKSGDAG